MAGDGFRGSLLRQLIVAVVCLKIAGVILIFDTQGLQAFDLPKSLFSRAIEWILIGLIAAAVIRFGAGIIVRTRVHLAAAFVGLSFALSTAVAANQYVALFGDQRYLGLTALVDLCVLYIAVAIAFRSADDWHLLFATFALATMLTFAYAVAQYVGFDPLVWTDDFRTRPFSTFGNPDQFGHYLSVVLGASLALTLFAPRGRVRFVAAVIALATVTLGTAVATRGVLLAAGAFLPALMLVRWASSDDRRRGLAAASLLAGLSLFALTTAYAYTPLGERLQAVGTDRSLQLRHALIATGFDAFVRNPILGVGPDNLGVTYAQYRQTDSSRVLGLGARQDSAHNFVIQAAATTGLIGLAAQLVFIATYVAGATVLIKRHTLRPVPVVVLIAGIAYWAHALVSVGTIAVDWVPWVGLGAVAALSGASGRTAALRTNRVLPIVAVLVVAISAMGAATGAHAWTANRKALEAMTLASQSPDRAIEAAMTATAEDPGRAEYWNVLGIASETAGRWTLAQASYEAAAARAPYEWKYWSNLARSMLRQVPTGDNVGPAARAAIGAAEKAVEADPREPLAQLTLADTALALGSSEIALAAAQRAVLLNPTVNYDARIRETSRTVRDAEFARQMLDAILAVRESVTLLLARAEVAIRQQDIETARRDSLRVLVLSPQNAEARRILALTGQ